MSVSSDDPARPDLSEIERHILNSLQQIRFGSLEIVVHDSRIVQIERSEKLRFDVKGKPLNDSLS
ncbi:MAG TPA: YezD family protein [Asticcacaulis sp.]|nr:YezD family protein [Asticcacaulis sp.]